MSYDRRDPRDDEYRRRSGQRRRDDYDGRDGRDGRDDDRDMRDRGGGPRGSRSTGSAPSRGRASRESSARERSSSARARDSDEWHERAGLDGYQKGAYTPSSGGARSKINSRQSRSGSRGGDQSSPELVRRVEQLEEQVLQLKKQNRMFLTFMKETGAKLTEMKDQRKNHSGTPRGGSRKPPQRKGRDSSDEDGAFGGGRDRDEDDEKEKRRKKAAIARTNLLKKKKQAEIDRANQQREEEQYSDEEEEPPPPRRKPPPKMKTRPAKKAPPPVPQYSDEEEDEPQHSDGGDHDEKPLGGGGGGGLSIYEQAAMDPTAFPDGGAPPPDPSELKACSNCGRKFAPAVLKRHVAKKICKKVRKVFNTVQQRLDAEALKLHKEGEKAAKKGKAEADKKKKNWKHERARFQDAIRAGKQMAQALKDGTPLSDLPPPPKSEFQDDRTPCPHCGRKFNANAAERHIPHCAKTKSRPGPPPGRRKPGRR